MQSGREDKQPSFYEILSGIAEDASPSEIIEQILDRITLMQKEKDPALLQLGDFFVGVIIQVANAGEFEPSERSDLFRMLANMFIYDMQYDTPPYQALALRSLQAIPEHQQTLDDLNQIIDLLTRTIQARQLITKNQEDRDKPRRHHQPTVLYLKQPKQLAEHLRAIMPYRLKAAEMDKANARAAEKEQDQVLKLNLPDAEKGVLLREIAWEYICTSNWRSERIKPLLEEAARCGDIIAKFCVEKLDQLPEDDFLFRALRLICRNRAPYSIPLLSLVLALPAHYEAARDELLEVLESDLDQDVLEEHQERFRQFQDLALINEHRKSEFNKIYRRLQELELDHEFEAFASPLKMVLPQWASYMKKYCDRDFSAVDDDETELKNKLLTIAKLHAKKVKERIADPKREEKRLTSIVKEMAPKIKIEVDHIQKMLEEAKQQILDSAKATGEQQAIIQGNYAVFAMETEAEKQIDKISKPLTLNEFKLAREQNVIKKHIELFREMAELFEARFPNITHFYLTQIPPQDLSVEDTCNLVELYFELDFDEEESFRLALPYAMKAADLKRSIAPKMEALRDEAINLEMLAESKGPFLMQMAWDYIALSKRWQASRVLPLWQEAANCNDLSAVFCLEHRIQLENSEFFLACTRRIVETYDAEHFDELTELLVDAESLPAHYHEARNQLHTLLFADDMDDQSVGALQIQLKQLASIAKRNKQLNDGVGRLGKKLEALSQSLILEADKLAQSKDSKEMRRQFETRAKAIHLIAKIVQRDVKTFIANDFSDKNIASDLHPLCNNVIDHVTLYLNTAIEKESEYYRVGNGSYRLGITSLIS